MNYIKICCDESIKKLYLDTYRNIVQNSDHKSYIIHDDYIDMSDDDDAGVDLIIPEDNIIKAGSFTKIDHKISMEVCRLNKDVEINLHYIIAPRSSISNISLFLHNSIGIIDKGYRGIVYAPVVNFGNEDVKLNAGQRLIQVLLPSFDKISMIIFSDKLSDSRRGSRGFGSTTFMSE